MNDDDFRAPHRTSSAAASDAAARTRIFIYGSCVSRDTFEVLDPSQFTLASYVARQSLVSAFTPPGTTVELPSTLSRFQRRMVQGDLASDLRRRFGAVRDDVDIVVWDLADERLGVYSLPDGSYVTRTPEIIGTSLEHQLARHGTLLAFGTDEHFALWRTALAAWLDLLREHSLLRRTVVLAVPWATRTRDGIETPSSFGVTATVANERFSRYFEEIRSAGISVLTTPDEQALASVDHRWGLAPFHYDAGVYESLTMGIERFTRSSLIESTSSPVVTHAHSDADLGHWKGLGYSVFTWPSPEAFSASEHLSDGVHRVAAAGTVIDLLLTGDPLGPDNPWQAIPVVFNGAVRRTEGAHAPYFAGLALSKEAGLPSILVADSTLTMHTDIALGWYTGCECAPLQGQLVRLLRSIRRRASRRLLLAGGSGGGFTALALAAELGPDVSVFCWNPQTDVLAYGESTVLAYLSSCFPSIVDPDLRTIAGREAARERLAAQGVRTVAWPGTDAATNIVYLQNLGDSHVDGHMRPYVEAMELEAHQNSWSRASVAVVLGHWGERHATPPREMLILALRTLAEGKSACETTAAVAHHFPDAFATASVDGFLASPTFEVDRDSDPGCAIVRPSATPDVLKWLSFAYYLMAGDERIAVRWYDREAAYRIDEPQAAMATSVTCFAQDTGGRKAWISIPI